MLNEEYFNISKELETHHAVFYKLWDLGIPTFTEHISTAGVVFDKDGDQISFEFNPKFWKKLNDYEKAFIISHECLHVILNHGYRIKDSEQKETANLLLDVVVNQTLVNNFGFDRAKISFEKELCWVDTIFPNQNIPDNESFEFYFNKFLKDKLNGGGSNTIDDHSGLEANANDMEEVSKELNETISDEEKEGLKEIIKKHFQNSNEEQNENDKVAGKIGGGIWTFANITKVKKKKKWETVIKKWSQQYIKSNFKDCEQWSRTNRRFTFIADELLLPTELEIEEDEKENNKIEVWFFQDTSGSCSKFVNRFFAAASSLPEERFEVKMHCFDTRVFKTTLESKKLYGFGGTCFRILENYIQQTIKRENKKYPEAVFVITDGYGTKVSPEIPNRWYWFLSTNYTSYIPKECNIFKLSDFE